MYILLKITTLLLENKLFKMIKIKNCTPFTNCICEMNNSQVDNAKDIDAVMLMYNLLEYSDNYTKIWSTVQYILWLLKTCFVS